MNSAQSPDGQIPANRAKMLLGRKVRAEYRDVLLPLHQGNPFIEALPVLKSSYTMYIKRRELHGHRFVGFTPHALTAQRSKHSVKMRQVQPLFDALELFGPVSDNERFIVPDTNSLIAYPDPAAYGAIAQHSSFRFLLTSTVLAELDRLKNHHRNPEFREKVLSVITRIKGWRGQGSLSDGVTVSKTISVQATANEPNMKAAPSWLDSSVADDRIIAGILEIQASHPNAVVIFVTGDINLLNKADVAGIVTRELP